MHMTMMRLLAAAALPLLAAGDLLPLRPPSDPPPFVAEPALGRTLKLSRTQHKGEERRQVGPEVGPTAQLYVCCSSAQSINRSREILYRL